jgi:hypothetical protein
MKASFADFTETYEGKVFMVFSINGSIKDEEVINQIAQEIKRLNNIQKL